MGIYDRDYERSYDTGSGWRDSYGQSGGNFGAWTTNTKLLVAMAGLFVVQLMFEPGFTELFGLPNDWVQRPWHIYGLLTYGFLHSTESFQHLLFNGIALFFFGRSIESRLGAKEYLFYFLTAVVAAGLVWTISESFSQVAGPVDPSLQGKPALLIGASGGISAVLVLFALWYPHSLIHIWGIIPVPAWLLVGLGLAFDILGVFGARGGNVAFTAHLGGALFGYLYYRNHWRITNWLPEGLLAGDFKMPSFKRRPKLKIHTEEEEQETADPLEDQIDRILRKIKAKGQDSLTREEQNLLQKASKRYQQKNR